MGRKWTDAEIEAKYGISREKHENRNDICNDLPTGKMRMSQKDKMLYIDDAGRHWRRNPDIFSSYHQPMSMPNAVFHSIVDMVIFCIDFPVPNMKFISINEDRTWSEVICNRYTGELIVDPQYFGTSNFCTDAPNGMKTGSLTTVEHVNWDVKPHELYGAGYKHIAKGIPVGYYDGDIPHPVILHEPMGGPKAIYMSKENDPKYKSQQASIRQDAITSLKKPTTTKPELQQEGALVRPSPTAATTSSINTKVNTNNAPNNKKPSTQQSQAGPQASSSNTTTNAGGSGSTTQHHESLQVQNLHVETLHVHTLHVHSLNCVNLHCENLVVTNLDCKTENGVAAVTAVEKRNNNNSKSSSNKEKHDRNQQDRNQTISNGKRKSTAGNSGKKNKLPKGWISVVDDESGDTYYYNERTGQSTWDRPVVY